MNVFSETGEKSAGCGVCGFCNSRAKRAACGFNKKHEHQNERHIVFEFFGRMTRTYALAGILSASMNELARSPLLACALFLNFIFYFSLFER